MKTIIWVILVLLFALAVFLALPNKSQSAVDSITLTFISPGDDGNVGTATSYELRYSATPVGSDTTSWWNSATIYPSMPAPLVAGTPTTVIVSPTGGFQTGNTYYFIMKACDEVPNCSGYSNVASKFLPDNIPPARITTLSAP